MATEFGGEVAGYYSKFRRGYDAPVIDWLVEMFGLCRDAIVIDLGCGTGQLAMPISARVRAVIGVDPEPRMLAHAAAEADRQGCTNLCWMLGSDGDLDALTTLLGAQSVDAVVIGNAIHLMDYVFKRALAIKQASAPAGDPPSCWGQLVGSRPSSTENNGVTRREGGHTR